MTLQIPVLSLIIFAPLLGVILLLFLNEKKHLTLMKWGAFGASLLSLILGVLFLLVPGVRLFNPADASFQLIEIFDWIPRIGVKYHLALDGISLWLLLLTAFIVPLAILFSFETVKTRTKLYYLLLLVMQSAMLGAFCALDLILFYIFFEAILIPMYMLIGIWGGDNRYYATWKFFFFTMVGSVLMLIAIIYLGISAGSFSVDRIVYAVLLNPSVQNVLFWAFVIAFAIKIPLFPLHTWLSDAHTEAPTAGSVILAAVLLKLGSYGFIRFCLPLFPQPSVDFAPMLATLAVIGVIYGSLVAIVQKDIKRLVAYSSVAHMGFVTMGIFSGTVEGITGSILQQINHGLSTAGLFLLVGMIYDRRHTRIMDQFGGIAKVMPVYYVMFLFIMLSSVGLPGLNGFVGEYLILVGSFKYMPIHSLIATIGVILAAIYLLWLVRKTFYGPLNNPENEKLKDLKPIEVFVLVPIIVLCVFIGLHSKSFTAAILPPVENLVQILERARQVSVPVDKTAPNPEVSWLNIERKVKANE